MGIARFENVGVYNLTFSTSSYGEGITTETLKFTSRPMVHEVKTSLGISEKYRIYQNLINFKFNYTPYVRDISVNQNLYSFKWRDQDWRIESAVESNDRMSITFLCYHNAPVTKV